MATTFTSDQVTNSAYAAISFPDGTPIVRRSTYIMSAAPVINDVYQMIPVFIGERVVNMTFIAHTDMDTSTGIVLDIGDGDVTDRYIDGSTVGQTGGVSQYGSGVAATATAAVNLNKVYTANDSLDVKVEVAPSGTGSAGTITLIAHIVKSV